MTLVLVHVAIIALITLICIKIKVWVPMLITLILSFTYFYWIISNSQPDGLSNMVFFIWPPLYTILCGGLWFLFNKIRLAL